MNKDKKELLKESLIKLKRILKRYTNYYKALYQINPSSADEFLKKQEHYFTLKSKSVGHSHCKHENKVETKIYIPKDKLNNIEKNLAEIAESMYYPTNLNQFLLYFESKYTKITQSGLKQGLSLPLDAEKDLLHRILLEGIPLFISQLLKEKLKVFEESISEQPMLLAHPSNITDPKVIDLIPSSNIEQIIKEDFTIIDKKTYEDLHEYEIYNQFKYLYMEGLFEDESAKDSNHRADFLFNFHINYFDKSKHKIISELSQIVYALPFELNKKFPLFSLQINEYVQCSYFRENSSFANLTCDGSFDHDTGKKLTFLLVLFPDEVELRKRIMRINIYDQKTKHLLANVELKTPLSGIIMKTRKVAYEIPKHDIPFILIFYFIHGPIDKDTFTC